MDRYHQIITVDEFDAACEAEPAKDDWEVFTDVRDGVPIREMATEVVTSKYSHPSGGNAVVSINEEVDALVADTVYDGQLLPDGLPNHIVNRFARFLTERLQEMTLQLNGEAADDVRDLSATGEVQSIVEAHAERSIPATV